MSFQEEDQQQGDQNNDAEMAESVSESNNSESNISESNSSSGNVRNPLTIPNDDEYQQSLSNMECPGFIQEEVHGVNCVSPEETPELLQTSLAKLAAILDSDEIPETEKKSYRKAQNLHLQQQQQQKEQEKQPSCCFVNTDDFRLRFLRAELFDVHWAARTLTKFLNLVEAVFGTFALTRPIQLDDFKPKALKAFRKGLFQFLPYRDRSGRRVLVIFPHEMSTIDPSIRLQILIYLCYTAGTNDVDTQRKGLVIVVWCQGHGGFPLDLLSTPVSTWTHKQMSQARPLRSSAVHFCGPNTAFYKLLQKLAFGSFLGHHAKMDARFRIHVGEPTEIQYAMQSYGIPTNTIPITFSSRTIKLVYFNQWLWIRQYIEQGFAIVECPGIYDVLVRQRGKATMYHPGNVWLIDLIQSKFEAHLLVLLQKQQQQTGVQGGLYNSNANNNNNSNDSSSSYYAILDQFKLTRDLLKYMVSELVQCISESSRQILTWYDNKGYGCVGWWTVLNDPLQLYNRLECMVEKEFKNLHTSITRAHRIQKRKLKIRMPQQQHQQQQSVQQQKPTQQTQILQSDTCMFRSQDGTTGNETETMCCYMNERNY